MLPAAGPQSSAGMHALGQNQTENQDQAQTKDLPQGSMPSLPQGQGQGQQKETIDTKLLAYLTANNTGEKFLFATTNAGTAEAYIIQTGQAVMAMGGFSGSDPILTVDKLKQMIADKEIKYFLSSSGGPGGGNSDVQTWISQNGKVVPQSEWQSSTTDSSGFGMGRNGAATLYEINP